LYGRRDTLASSPCCFFFFSLLCHIKTITSHICHLHYISLSLSLSSFFWIFLNFFLRKNINKRKIVENHKIDMWTTKRHQKHISLIYLFFLFLWKILRKIRLKSSYDIFFISLSRTIIKYYHGV
jgi:hypothetical protein